jgi:hypothetical protein
MVLGGRRARRTNLHGCRGEAARIAEADTAGDPRFRTGASKANEVEAIRQKRRSRGDCVRAAGCARIPPRSNGIRAAASHG